ncbi:MAG: deoxyguanosinetriphosphate triphosphohydrolase [Bacteroidaceae bacterium]
MEWRKLLTTRRLGLEAYHTKRNEKRSTFQRDYDRLVFSAPFRRLQNKTQVFPLPGSIFVHNRLTHSLEVSCVGRSLGTEVYECLLLKHPELKDSLLSEIGTIVSAACLAHDMGNPPFGHSGEKAISSYFAEQKGQRLKALVTEEQWDDLVHFEGNANAFRLLTHQFLGRREGGFVMTYTTLASVVKYPFASSLAGDKSKFGFFTTEEERFKNIADELGMLRMQEHPLRYCRHPLVFLVEAADDICYQIMDIEDSHKLKILTTDETIALLINYFDEEGKAHIKETFKLVDDVNEQIAYLRSSVIGLLINECVKLFVEKEDEILKGEFQKSLISCISERPRKAYEMCSKVAYESIYGARLVLEVELAGYQVINTLMDLFIDAVCNPEKTYSKLLINRVSDQYNIHGETLFERVQAVMDYISGMTDVYALDLYQKIQGNGLPMV